MREWPRPRVPPETTYISTTGTTAGGAVTGVRRPRTPAMRLRVVRRSRRSEPRCGPGRGRLADRHQWSRKKDDAPDAGRYPEARLGARFGCRPRHGTGASWRETRTGVHARRTASVRLLDRRRASAPDGPPVF